MAEADALPPDSLPAAVAGVDTADYRVHSMASGKHFGELGLAAAGHFADATVRAGVIVGPGPADCGAIRASP